MTARDLLSKNDELRIHQLLPNVTTLGPYKRYAIWIQGCGRQCPGCIAPDAQDPDGGRSMKVENLVKKILRYPDHEGLTISGGEPFLQAPALCRVIDSIQEERDYGVIIYTGYTLEELQGDDAPEGAADLLKRTDLLIDGPYIRELNDDASLRGSSNQRILPLTERYRDQLAIYGVPGERTTDIRWTEDGFFISGVPSKATARMQWPDRDV